MKTSNDKIRYPFTMVPNIAFDSEIFNDREFFRFFCFARFKAPRMGRNQPFYSRSIELEPLEFIFGREKWADWLGLKKSQVHKFIERLKNSNYISKVDSKSNSKMTVYKWIEEAFSGMEQQQKQQQTNSKTTANQHSIKKNNKQERLKALFLNRENFNE